MITKGTTMSYQHAHLLELTRQHPGPSATLATSRAAAHSYALQQAVAELRSSRRPARPVRVSVWQRARRVVSRPRPA